MVSPLIFPWGSTSWVILVEVMPPKIRKLVRTLEAVVDSTPDFHVSCSMEPAINAAAGDARAVLLANHGPVVSGKTLTDAVYAAEELEEAAKLYLLLRGTTPRLLTVRQVDDLLTTFG